LSIVIVCDTTVSYLEVTNRRSEMFKTKSMRRVLACLGCALVSAFAMGALIGCGEQEEGQASKAPAAKQETRKLETPREEKTQPKLETVADETKENEMRQLKKVTELALKERPMLRTVRGDAETDVRAERPLEPVPMRKPKLDEAQPEKMPQTRILEEVAEIETRFGTIYLEFFPDAAPKTVENFKKLARSGFYDGTTFHRVVPRFVIQGGDPNSRDDDRLNDGQGGPGWTIPAEFNDTKHDRGVLSMARGPDPNSAGSQFFICLERLPHLDHKYTAFGNVIGGMDIVDKIAALKRDSQDNPIDKVEMKVRLIKREPVGPSAD